jgi:hypothetical protein
MKDGYTVINAGSYASEIREAVYRGWNGWESTSTTAPTARELMHAVPTVDR